MGEGRAVHRLVRIIYTVRVLAFAWCFCVIAVHAWERSYGALFWTLLVLQFFLYPHLLLVRTLRARDQKAAEFQHLYSDAFCFALWVVALGFPTWIAYALMFASTVNAMLNRGLPGLMRAVVASSLGLVAGIQLFGYHLWPATSTLVTAMCFFGSLAYTVGVGFILHRQTMRLADSRRQLAKSEQRYRLITEHAGDLIALVDPQGRWVYASPSYRRHLSEAELEPGRDAFRFVHAEDAPRVREAFARVLQSGRSGALAFRLAAGDGAERRLETSIQPVVNGGGRVENVVLVSRDVTEERRQRERLEVAAHALQEMAEAVVISTAAHVVVSVNRAFTRITGYGAEEVIGKPESQLRSALQPVSFYADLFAEVEASGRWAGTLWSRRKDGGLYREWRHVSAVRDGEGRITHYVSLFFDTSSPSAAAALTA